MNATTFFKIMMTAAIALSPTLAYAQQVDERSIYEFRVLGSNAALNKAIAIEQVENGFGGNSFATTTITTTSNETTSVGTLSEVTAILEGDNSTITLTSNPVQDATGSTMTATGDQTSTNAITIGVNR